MLEPLSSRDDRAPKMLKVALYAVNGALCLVLLVIFMGGWTRINDAGLSCPDWPGCFGFYSVPSSSLELSSAQQNYPNMVVEQSKGWLEMLHRYLAGLLGLLIMILTLLGIKLNKMIRKYPLKLSCFLLLLVVFQAALGMWTVTLKLLPIIVTAHLAGGLLTCVLLAMLRAKLGSIDNGTAQRAVLEHSNCIVYLVIAVILVVVQILLGGWTSSNYAGWGCSSWLGCNPQLDISYDFNLAFKITTDIQYSHQGGNLPLTARGAIQIVHRIAAVAVLLYLTAVYFWLAKDRAWRSISLLALGLTLLQIILGMLSVAFAMPSVLAMAHHVTAVLLLLTVVAMVSVELKDSLILEVEYDQTKN